MGVLSSFERRLSGMVEGTFAKIFKGFAEPVQIAGALQRELDDRKVASSRRMLVPNTFIVELSTADFDRLNPYAEALSDELAAMVREHAEEQRYSFAGPVTVFLHRDDLLTTGVFRIQSEVSVDGTIGAAASAHPAAGADPAPSVRPALSRPVVPSVPAATPVAAAPPGVPPAPQRPAPGQPPASTAAPAAFAVSYGAADPGGERLFPLTAAVVRIGRAHDVDLRVDDSSVSRQHAEVRRLPEGRGHAIADLGSTNGTIINGEKITARELHDGDTVQIGTATLVYRAGHSPARNQPPAG